jgi:hypothetical protein
MKNPRSFRRNCSGQVLVITSLVVVMLLISTIIYVNETQKNAPIFVPNGSASFSAIKQSAVHTLISALASISNGANPSVLVDDLNRFKVAVENHAYGTISQFDYVVSSSPPYVNGTWIFWGSNGQGAVGAAVNFALNASGASSDYSTSYSVVVASSINVGGTYTQLNESRTSSLTCALFNEEKPALAQTLQIYYQKDNSTGWTLTSPTITDFGNGTYLAWFATLNATLPLLPVSVHCVDTRGISIWVNASLPIR